MTIVVAGKQVWKVLWKDKEAGSGHVGPCVRGWQHRPDSKHIPKSSYELWKALLLARSAPGCSKPAVSNARAGPKPRGPHLQVWGQGTLNHISNCTSHVLRVISQLLENNLGLLCKAGWSHSNHLWGRTLVPCCSPDHAQGNFKRQTIQAKPQQCWHFHSTNDQVPVPWTVSWHHLNNWYKYSPSPCPSYSEACSQEQLTPSRIPPCDSLPPCMAAVTHLQWHWSEDILCAERAAGLITLCNL